MKKSKCDKCNNYFSNNNYKKHIKICNGNYKKFEKSNLCKHCGIDWDTLNISTASDKANHSRWCLKNPKRNQYEKTLAEVVRGGFNNETYKKRSIGILEAWKNGSYTNVDFGKSFRNKSHTEETKDILRQKALASKHRRLRKGMILYKDIWLDSSWEYELAKRLDELEIRWERPKPIIWIDNNGIQHNYFPDFYLLDYDLFLDPKNPAAFENQKEKIEILKKTYNNIRFISSIVECINFKL